jgi:hypothetical protein
MKVFTALGAAVAATTAIVEYLHEPSLLRAAGAFLAGALAVALVWFVTTLPGLTLRGLVIGGFFVVAGMVSWTFFEQRYPAWIVLGIEGATFLVWAYPWLRTVPALTRLGTAWLGLAYWVLGVVGALLVVHIGIAVERLAYAGAFTLAALAVIEAVCRWGRDLTVGIVAAFLLAIAALVLSGSGNLFESLHVVPHGGFGANMEHRFWGGKWLLYHPNSLGAAAVAAAARIGLDRAFAPWQRIAVTVLAGFVVFETNSRTAFLMLGGVAVLHALLLWRRRGGDLPEYRRTWVAVAAPFAVLAMVLVLSGGQGFLFKSRYGGGDPTSGRTDTWIFVGKEWARAGWAEKLFGDAQSTRAVVVRTADKLKLTTDNAAVGALRRGGGLGVLAFLLGLGLLVLHAVWGVKSAGGRRAPPAWFTAFTVGALPTIVTSDWLLGGTGGTLWILLLAGEAWLVLRPAPAADAAPLAAAIRN